MRILTTIVLLLVFSLQLRAQIPASSPALDPDFVILQPKEEFKGRYANQVVGALIKTIAPLRWDVPEGGVFLNSVDTAGWQTKQGNLPVGPLKQGSSFSLFNRSLFRVSNLGNPGLIFTKGKNEYPVMAGFLGPLMFLFADDSGKYIDTTYYHAYTPNAFLMGGGTGYAVVDANNDGLDDFFAIETFDGSSNTAIGLWYSTDIVYKGDTLKDGLKLIPASKEWTIPNERYGASLHAADVDRDGVCDLVFRTSSRKFFTYFGKIVNDKWDIDTIVSFTDSAISTVLFMDFLYEDGIPDLLLGTTDDTIFCFSGHRQGFLRNGYRYNDADLVIPAPAKIDPASFSSNLPHTLGDIYDAGNINGSGTHSLAVMGYKGLTSLSGVPYIFIYSGGKAADEKADAIYTEGASVYSGYGNFDTVHTDEAMPSGFILGDPVYNPGFTGKIWYFLGEKSIPHKANLKWSVPISKPSSNLTLEATQEATSLSITVGTESYTTGSLAVYDMLGRKVYERNVYYEAGSERHCEISTANFSSGGYAVTYTQDGQTVSKKVMIVNSIGETERRFLPERYLLPPYLPAASLWMENNYYSSKWEEYTYSNEQRKELMKLKRERSGLSFTEYSRRLDAILHKPEADIYTEGR